MVDTVTRAAITADTDWQVKAQAKGLASQPIINSTVDSTLDVGTGYGFRGWHYVTMAVSLTADREANSGCLDTGADITLVDRKFFQKQTIDKVPVRKMATPIIVRDIGSNRHSTDEYAILSMYFEGSKEGKPVQAHIRREVHLVDELKANILIRTDVLGPEEVVLDLGKKKAFIGSCKVTIPIQVKAWSGKSVQRPVHILKTTIVPPLSTLAVPIHQLVTMPVGQDFLFEPDDINISLYAHMVDTNTAAVIVQNDTSQAIRISRNFRLGHVNEIEYPNAFYASGEDVIDLAL